MEAYLHTQFHKTLFNWNSSPGNILHFKIKSQLENMTLLIGSCQIFHVRYYQLWHYEWLFRCFYACFVWHAWQKWSMIPKFVLKIRKSCSFLSPSCCTSSSLLNWDRSQKYQKVYDSIFENLWVILPFLRAKSFAIRTYDDTFPRQ